VRIEARALRSHALQAAPALLCGSFQVWALLRFYRRFIFDEPGGRVFGLADDVYISACFGRSLFAGQGFVWYAGAPRVEGISNPAWSLLIGALHRAPGFTEDRLGLYVIALNALLLAALGWLFARSLSAARPGLPGGVTTLLTLLLAPCCAALAYWSAEGFEVALLGVLCLALLERALRARGARDAAAIGGMLVLGLATRMDFVLIAAPALLLFAARRRPGRELLLLAGGSALALFGLLIARHAYYGEWLPNTYYLKASGWPLRARLARGAAQNWASLALLPVLALVLCIPGARRHALREAPHALAAWLGFAACVLYSTLMGGDSWGLFAGYDRHSAVGGVLLVWGCIALLVSLPARRLFAGCALALLVAAAPVVADARGSRLLEGLFGVSPQRGLEREWIRYGKAFQQISRSGARIAVCPAGAIIYFSQRGGVDLLGKLDPYVAHLPVATHKPANNRCWRDAPGHNKEDDARVFELRNPDFSRYRPPPEQAQRYRKLKFEGQQFYARQDSPFVIQPP
jgi:arabinofuranosyltransferase